MEMDLKVNLLWTLGSYDTPLIHFVELLQNKQTASIHDELWDMVRNYIKDQENCLVRGYKQTEQVDFTPVYQQVRDIYTGRHEDRSQVVAMISYAHSLSACSSHGMGPWNRVKRLIEQEHEQQMRINALPQL